MRRSKFLHFFTFTLIACCFTLSSEACRLHAKLAARTSSLPGDSVYHLDAKWVNQDNTSVSFRSLEGQPRIVAMVYTKCPSSCPLLVQDVKSIVSQLPADLRKDLHIDLFSFDSDGENAKSLQGFRTKYKMDDNWSAYAGSTNAVSELAAILGLQFKKLPSGEFIHSNVFFLLNSKGEIIAKQEGVNRDGHLFVQKIQQAFGRAGST